MSQTLTLELSDKAFEAIQQQARSVGSSPAALVKELLERQYRSLSLSDDEKQKARIRFENYFGSVDLGHPTGADNEGIDADLARAYADTHEPH